MPSIVGSGDTGTADLTFAKFGMALKPVAYHHKRRTTIPRWILGLTTARSWLKVYALSWPISSVVIQRFPFPTVTNSARSGAGVANQPLQRSSPQPCSRPQAQGTLLSFATEYVYQQLPPRHIGRDSPRSVDGEATQAFFTVALSSGTGFTGHNG